MKLRERCVCGAEFEADGDFAMAQMDIWRVRHDAVCRATLPKQAVVDERRDSSWAGGRFDIRRGPEPTPAPIEDEGGLFGRVRGAD